MEKISRVAILFILACALCSYTTYRVMNNDVDVRTVWEDGHKYVVATIGSHNNTAVSGISITHSEACPCKKRQ